MLTIDYQLELKNITSFLQKTVKSCGYHKVILALSGGIDSTVAFYLCLKALGKNNAYVMISPYDDYDKTGHQLIDHLININNIDADHIFRFNIKKVVNQINNDTTTVSFWRPRQTSGESGISYYQKGNIMARVRMTYLYSLANKHHFLVCGTENKSEYLLGYFTRFGDDASDFEPIRHLYKTQVIELAKYLNIPKEIIIKQPTAGLWHGQTDAQELGFSYADADQILQLYFNNIKNISIGNMPTVVPNYNRDEGAYRDEKQVLLKIYKKFDKKIVNAVISRVNQNKFKHLTPYHL